MSFREAIRASPSVANAYHPGLQALPATDRDKISCDRPQNLTGSINLDGALEVERPHAPRWDYGIGYRTAHRERAIWVEVHPASSTSIHAMLNKLRGLKHWLQTEAPKLRDLTIGEYHWIATDGRVAITANSPQARRLAAEGLRGPVRRLRIT